MAATLAGICRIPLTASLILFEITRDYGIILPILVSVAVSSLQVSSRDTKEEGEKARSFTSNVPSISSSSSNSKNSSPIPYADELESHMSSSSSSLSPSSTSSSSTAPAELLSATSSSTSTSSPSPSSLPPMSPLTLRRDLEKPDNKDTFSSDKIISTSKGKGLTSESSSNILPPLQQYESSLEAYFQLKGGGNYWDVLQALRDSRRRVAILYEAENSEGSLDAALTLLRTADLQQMELTYKETAIHSNTASDTSLSPSTLPLSSSSSSFRNSSSETSSTQMRTNRSYLTSSSPSPPSPLPIPRIELVSVGKKNSSI
mmetsp:Transcript_18301/g.29787  ORF Transcript_18301/g.29787 Transcript_18301/m.29787 type:complete len:317 (-) Transcript_18301:69-1019(-)